MAGRTKARRAGGFRPGLRTLIGGSLAAVFLAGVIGLIVGRSDAAPPVDEPSTRVVRAAPRPAPATFAPATVARLGDRIDAELRRLDARTRTSVLALDPATGQPLYARNADRALIPASTQKLVTAAAAYDLLGPGWRFSTTFEARGGWAEGRVDGDLVVRGTGDPTLSDRFFDDADQAMDFLAEHLVRAGLKEVTGRLLADDSYFAGPRRGPNWPKDAYVQSWMVDVTPLAFNDDQVRVISRPEAGTAAVALRPDVGYGAVDVRLELTDRRGDHAVAIYRDDQRPEYTVRGKLFTGLAAHAHDVNVADGSLYYLHGLQAALARRGVAVRGGAPARLEDERRDPRPRSRILVYRSTLERTLDPMLKNSQNLYAELVFRVLGAETQAEGSFAGGSLAITRWLLAHGLLEENTVIADGSGLSRDDRLSARQLVAILGHMARRDALFPRFREALAAPGGEGTLRNRMPELADRVVAKTGTLNGVSSLAGYVRTGDDRWVAFAALFNDCDKSAARACQDRICAALADLAVSP